MLTYLQEYSEVDFKREVNSFIYRHQRLLSIDSPSCWEAGQSILSIEHGRVTSKSAL
jgi:hypothetical protein